jgi:predicted Zn-dependent peptidase
VATTEWAKLMYGEDSPITAEVTEATVNSITRDDVVAWHKKYWGANNAILVVTGDFAKADMLQKLEATFGKWRNADAKATHQSVIDVMQGAQAAGYPHISFATQAPR